MKKIIKGRRYDTDKATEIATDSHSYPSDFRHWSETLYRTPRGNWFLVGAGGPMSRYSRSTGDNSWSGSTDNIVSLSAEDARTWLESADETEAIEKYFGDAIEDA